MRLTVGEKIQRDPIPAKTFPGNCIGIFDLGKQFHPKYKTWKPKVLFMFEIPAVRAEITFEDGTQIDRPRLASRIYGFTTSDRGYLKPMLTGWRGKAYEVGEDIVPMGFLGKPAAVQIVHGKVGNKVYSNIGSVSELMEGVEAPMIETELMSFQFEDHTTLESVEEALDKIPEWAEWVANKIRDSEEYANLTAKADSLTGGIVEGEASEEDDDVPF